MSKKAILAIIILMTAALMGVSIIQIRWISESLKLNETNYDSKVFFVLNNVKKRLVEDVRSSTGFIEEYTKQVEDNISGDYFRGLEKPLMTKEQWQRRQQLEYEIQSNFILLDSSPYLENLNQEKLAALDKHLKSELSNQGINLGYEYGLYSNETNSFFIRNGRFVVELGDSEESSTISENLGLRDTEYKVSILDQMNEDESEYLHLYFPEKSGFIWKGILPIMLLSILFTALILFCFIYTIYIIFRQKKISEIKNDFINNMTHEFKTPIATISLASDSIGSPRIIGSEDKIRRFLKIIKEENKRMLNQVEKVLQMAQLDRREISIKPSEININELVNKAVTHAELKVQAKDGTISLMPNAKRSEIVGDQTHISNMIANLLDNALKYSKGEPHIVVETMDDKDGVKFSVKDNGIGMSKESIKYIYDKFYRIHTGNRHDVKGFGLGLSYVKAMAEAHGGKVMVKSELGEGSTFTVFLPFKPK